MAHMTRFINRIARLSSMHREAQLKEYGLNGIHHTYIITICQLPGITQEALARRIFVNKSNVTRQLAYLEKIGYIERRMDDSDRRKMRVFPTQKAQDILPMIEAMLVDWNEELLSQVPVDERDMMLVNLQKMMDHAEAIMEKKEEI